MRNPPLPHGLSAQDYYDILIQQPQAENPPPGFDVIIVPGNGTGKGSKPTDAPDIPSTPSNVPAEVIAALEKLDSLVDTGNADLITANLEALRKKPRPNFQLWNRFLTRMFKDAYGEVETPSFRMTDPRLCNIDMKGMRLPYNATQHDRGARPTVYLYIDASGSMAQEELNWACQIAASIPTSKFNLIIHPFRRSVDDRVTVSGLLQLRSHGGTSFNNAVNHFLNRAKDTDYAFVFTDGDDTLDVTHARLNLMSRVTWFLNSAKTAPRYISELKDTLAKVNSAVYTEEFFK
jgi:hypothetical protein